MEHAGFLVFRVHRRRLAECRARDLGGVRVEEDVREEAALGDIVAFRVSAKQDAAPLEKAAQVLARLGDVAREEVIEPEGALHQLLQTGERRGVSLC